ncbi:MAG: hypothetical protein ABIW79_09530 [Gemmatimonas sp.]
MQVSRGRTGSAGGWKGLLWGGGIGLLAGVAAESEGLDSPSGALVGAGLAAGSIFGGLIGLAVGAEQWDSVPITPAVGLQKGFQFGVRVR